MQRANKRPRGEPALVYYQRRLREVKEAFKNDPFGSLQAQGLLAFQIREKYQAWEEKVRREAEADLDARRAMLMREQ